MALPAGRSHLNRVYSRYKKGARHRGIEFNLTLDDVRNLVIQRCFYCGATPKVPKVWHNVRHTIPMNGIDRVDSSLGYFVGNCVPCCTRCNYFKRGKKVEDFLNSITEIYEWMAKP